MLKNHVGYDEKVPMILSVIQEYWANRANSYGDIGSCVLGAGFEFEYKDQKFFMPPRSRCQGSISWEHCKDDIESLLVEIGATEIYYRWGYMD